ncbi:hypothetical protein PV328_007157 [Microctonus aethiopoides]|uniref:Uncharacterized protein n=1 Tax=Microctonus aethiopoides TaxID=144406 RepID=A0AA39KUB0_9HYME|nr:hypothetical protein PV328_007157 [Microctonus aethiopoides]
MGIISSTFLSLAVQLAWNCQRFLDPRYRYIEPIVSPDDSSAPMCRQFALRKNVEKQNSEGGVIKKISVDGVVQNNYSHQQNRHRRHLRYRRRRRSSFDAALIIRSLNNNGIVPFAGHRVISSTPNTLTRQPAPNWNGSSTSSTSSSSSSVSSSEDSDADVHAKRLNEMEKIDRNDKKNQTQDEKDLDNNGDMSGEKRTITAAEEAAFRMTAGRGHFSRSKKDRFLNNLRLEKRLNDFNQEFFDPAFRIHSRSLHRHHSGDLIRKIV